MNNRQARAASMISNCYSHNNREKYIERLNSIIPVTRLGFCSSNKCRHMRNDCLNQLADTNPFYLAFENSLCQDYVTEKYANVIMNNRMIPIVFSKNSNQYFLKILLVLKIKHKKSFKFLRFELIIKIRPKLKNQRNEM